MFGDVAQALRMEGFGYQYQLLYLAFCYPVVQLVQIVEVEDLQPVRIVEEYLSHRRVELQFWDMFGVFGVWETQYHSLFVEHEVKRLEHTC